MQKIALSIPEPCHENWQQMTPTQQGRYCNACAKVVIDFSTMTDIQVLNYFSTHNQHNVCGRALPEQLNRPIIRPVEPKKRLFWYWNYIAMFFMFFAKGNAAKAQGAVKAATELSPVKQKEVNKLLAGKVGEMVASNISVKGKILDEYANPVPFATISFKGTNDGRSADVNGNFTINAAANTVLMISAAGFHTLEVVVGNQPVINVILERNSELKEVVVAFAGGISFRNLDNEVLDKQITHEVVLKVRDEKTGNPLDHVSISVSKNKKTEPESFITDDDGMVTLNGIKKNDRYLVSIKAFGYDAHSFNINGAELKEQQKDWVILLKAAKRSAVNAKKLATDQVNWIGKMEVIAPVDSLYVIDGTIRPKAVADDLRVEDIEDRFAMDANRAVALYGEEGKNGVIVITTRQAKEKNLKEVVVCSDFGVTRRMRGTFCGVDVKDRSLQAKIANTEAQLRAYPNPVQRGQALTLEVPANDPGLYRVNITDANGRVILQQQVNAVSKEGKGKIQVDPAWSAGIYFISLLDNKDQIINKTSFIVR